MVCPITEIPAGKTVCLESIDAGKGLKHRLAVLGLCAHCPIKIIHNDHCGQIVVNVRDSKVVLGRGMSEKIFVSQC